MVDFSTPLPVGLPPTFLPALLQLLPSGVVYYTPVYDAAGIVIDFEFAYLNPVAQRMLGLPAQPAVTYVQQWPGSVTSSAFAFHRTTFLAREPAQLDQFFQADGYDICIRAHAVRLEAGLLVTFTDAADQPRTVVEETLRQSQASERAARTEAEAEHHYLYQALMQLPANFNLLRGPEHVFELVNSSYQQLFPNRQLLGRPIREALPELAGQGFFEALREVEQTGQPLLLPETETWADFQGNGQYEKRYYNAWFLPLPGIAGRANSILNVAIDVTSQVQARQQVQILNEELAVINEELRASNDEYLLANTFLSEAQQELRQLNQELEARVAARTADVQRARAEAERQRRQWEQLFMRAPAAICIFNGPEWIYEFVNPDYQAMFYSRELLGKRLLDALPELTDQRLLDILHHVYNTGETYQGHEVLVPLARTEDGPIESIYFDLTYQARYDEAGQVDGLITYAYDVTQQVLARREREARQGELQRIFEQAPVAISVLRGPQLVIELANAAISHLWGRLAAQTVGRPYSEAMPETIGQGFEAMMRRVLATGQPSVITEMPVTLARTHTGQPAQAYITFLFHPLFDEHSIPSGLIAVGTEVTEQVLARQQVQDLNEELAVINEELTATNEELNHSNTQLTRTNVDLDTFVYTASHDLKAPITNIEGLLLALQEHLPAEVWRDELVSQLLEMMQGAVERFRVTINQLTDVSRLQHAQNQPAEQVWLSAVVEDVRLDLLPMLQAAAGQLSVEVEPGLVVFIAPKNLRSVVYNLLSNAIKYQQPSQPPAVSLRAVRAGSSVMLTVQDNGLGLTSAQQQQLFGLFQRLHTHVEGTGVGLYMVKRMVENAGGSITVQSQPGQGTTFSILLPS